MHTTSYNSVLNIFELGKGHLNDLERSMRIFAFWNVGPRKFETYTYKHPLLAHLPAFGVPKTSFHLGPFLAHRGGYVVLTFGHCVFNLIGHDWCIIPNDIPNGDHDFVEVQS